MQLPTHFIANSDYPFDMIIYYKYVEYVHGTTPTEFEHHLGFAPLLFGQWSETKDFAVSLPYINHPVLESRSRYVDADDQKIYIHFDGVGAGAKCWLKIYGFAPITWTGDCAPTAQSNSAILLDTDNNYSPLLAVGAIQPRRLDNPDTPGEQTGIAKDIGKDGLVEVIGRVQDLNLYYSEPLQPMVMLWKTTASTGKTTPAGFTALFGPGYGLRNAPYASYNQAGAQGSGKMVLSIYAGITRTGQANYDDVYHFRVYG